MNLKLFNVLATFFAFCGAVAYADYTLTEFLVITDSLLIVGAITHYVLSRSASGGAGNHSVMAIGLIILFWIAYLVKLPILINFPNAFWVVPNLVTAEGLRREIPFAFFLAALGYSVLLLSIASAPTRRAIQWQMAQFRPNLSAFIFISIISLVLKYILKDSYSLGVPTVDPVYLGVPMLTGFTTMLIEIGVFILVNMLLFVGFYTARTWILTVGMFAAFGNAAIELLFGSKEFLMYQLVLTFAYIFIFKRFSPIDRIKTIRKKARVLTVVTVMLGVITLVLYKFFNLFRYARFSNDLDVISAINFLSVGEAVDAGTSFLQIWNRMNGIELLTAVTALRERFGEFDLLGIFTGAVTEKFTFIVVGTNEANVHFGLTLFGHLYISGGIAGMVFGVFLISLLFVFLQNCVLRLNVINEARIAALPALWILMVRVLFGGGNLVLVAKEFFVFLLVFWVLASLLFNRARSTDATQSRPARQQALT